MLKKFFLTNLVKLLFFGKTIFFFLKKFEAHFKNFNVQPGKNIILDRFPVPRFIDTDQGGSQARFLLAKVFRLKFPL